MKLEEQAQIFLSNYAIKPGAMVVTGYNNTAKADGKKKGRNKRVRLDFLLAGFARTLPEREVDETCPDCNGTGTQIINSRVHTCGTCNGKGRT